MKKIMMTGMIMFALSANAQQTGTRYSDTTASQSTTPPPQNSTRTATKVEDVKMQSNGEIDAEKQAKDKGSSKNQTQVNPEKIAPIVGDTIKRPKPARKK